MRRSALAGSDVVAVNPRAGCSGNGVGGRRGMRPTEMRGRLTVGRHVVVSSGATALSERNTTGSR